MLKLLIILVSYLLGSVSFAYLISKHFYHIDIRNYGSKNAGATNVLRVIGGKSALIVLLLDVLKGVIAVLLGRLIGGEGLALLCGVVVVVGHNWPIFLNFKGGKGIATSLGVILGIYPLGALIMLLIGILVIAFSRYVSLGSVTAAVVFPVLMLLSKKPLPYVIFAFVLSFLALFQHRSNIRRLLTGKESKIGEKTSPRVK